MIDQRGSKKKEKRNSVLAKEMIKNSEGVIRIWKMLIEGAILDTRFLFGIFLTNLT